ncbi:hypothetical protein Tco_0538597 [Tanacetum coccineum]
MIISEFDYTQEFVDEIGELRAISGHMLRAARVQIPKDNLDDLHSLREEDGTSEIMDPQDLLGSFLILSFFVLPEGCGPLALVDGFTPVEDNICLLEARKILIQMLKIHTDDNVADLLTNAFNRPRVINSPCYHNKELASPEQTATAKVVPKSVAGSSFPADCLLMFKFNKTFDDRYVVPTGRVVVPAGRYIVHAGKVILIVSTDRLSLVPTGRVLSPGRVK